MSTFKDFWSLGYRRLVPVLPPDSVISERSSLNRKGAAGKAVGIRGRDGSWHGYDWVNYECDEQDLDRWQAMLPGIGIKTGQGLLGIDADTLNVSSARTIVEATLRHFGPLPVRVGLNPKALYPIRVSAPMLYTRIEFGERDDKGRLKDRVEILSDSRQFVAHGIHATTLKPYTWPMPLVPFDELPIVSPAQIVAFLKDLRTLLPAAQPLVTEGSKADSAPVDQATLVGDLETVRRAVAVTPNTSEQFPSRESYIGYGYAIRAALPNNKDEAFEIWAGWARRWKDGENDPGVLAKDWERFRPPYKRGASWLYELAEKFSPAQFSRAETFFQPIEDYEDNPFSTPINLNPLESGKLLELVTLQDAARSALEHSSKPLIKGLLDQGTLSVLYGESNTGKTFVAMDLAFAISAGQQWGGMRTAGLPVLYVAAEGGAGARKRCDALMRKHPLEAAQARFFLRLSSVNLLRADADLNPLIATVRSVGPIGLVVIDTLSRAMAGGDENASTDMGALVKNIDALRLATGAHVMAVHHSGKDRAKGARGHSLLRAATDTEIEVADNQILVTKQRDLDKAFTSAFVLDVVTLGADVDGDPVTSCTVRLVAKNELPVGEATPAESVVLDAMSAVEAGSGGKGAALRAIVAVLQQGGVDTDEEGLRSNLRRMEQKKLVRKAGRGCWMANRVSAVAADEFFEDESSSVFE